VGFAGAHGLRIEPVPAEDTGTDQAEVATPCGSVLTASFTNRVNSAEFNNDSDIGTDADVEAFFRVLGRGVC
jgi:hypothetical protein